MSLKAFFVEKMANVPKRRKSRGLITHDLENRRSSDYSLVEDLAELSGEYSEYREELLDEDDER